MHFFLTICAVAVAITFLGGESAGTDIVSTDGKLKVREATFIEIKIPEFKTNQEYILNVYCVGQKECLEVQASGEAQGDGAFTLQVGEKPSDPTNPSGESASKKSKYCKSDDAYDVKYCEAEIQKNEFAVYLKITESGTKIKVKILGGNLDSATWSQNPDYTAGRITAQGAWISLNGEAGKEYRVNAKCTDTCQDPEARGEITSAVVAYLGAKDDKAFFCKLVGRNMFYRSCRATKDFLEGAGKAGKELYLTLSVKEKIEGYKASIFLKNLDSLAIIEDSQDAS